MIVFIPTLCMYALGFVGLLLTSYMHPLAEKKIILIMSIMFILTPRICALGFGWDPPDECFGSSWELPTRIVVCQKFSL